MGRNNSKQTRAGKRERARQGGGGERSGPAVARHPLFVLATRLPMVLLGVAVVLLIGGVFTEVSPALNTVYEDYIGAVMVGAFLAAILIAGVMGAVIMMGWRAGFVGVIFAASVAAAGAGAITGEALWTNLGIGGFALSCVGYYLIGELSGYLPIATKNAYGSLAMIPGGVIMAVVGIVSDTPALVLFGFGGAGAAVGVAGARWWRRRSAGAGA
ncbi:hypothetical protein [Glaciibacter sp. 2TAF33]|uniref:hypothetical protein n=1 Tax=Glaciibacter sp. 2TAF33 TaxID=3233015 RepID=UPI003F928722